MIESIAVQVKDVTGKMFLREHVGEGAGDGVSFKLSRGLGMPSLFIEVDDGPTFVLSLTQDHVTEVLASYLDQAGSDHDG